MAYIYPPLNKTTNLGEQFMYEQFQTLLPSGFICYHNRKTKMLEFDFAILVPGRGVLICEVKGHKAEDIKRVQGDYYYLKDDKPIYSPYEQANKYRYLFAALVNGQIKKDIPVFAVACFPFINKDAFFQKELHTLAPHEVTLLADDLNPSLTTRIINLLADGRKKTEKQFSELTLNVILKIRRLFEPESSIAKTLNFTENKPASIQRTHYSGVLTLPVSAVSSNKTAVIEDFIHQWRSGTKLCIVTDDKDFLNEIRLEVDNFIRMLDATVYERFSLFDPAGQPKDRTFNMELYCQTDVPLTYRIEYDNDLSPPIRCLLSKLDENTAFNLKQYELEHAEINKDIMVIAGAGTGKTTSMIARINYLIYRHALTADRLSDAVFMLTFTNEAAKNMKKKLKDYFQDYFLLTMDYEALRLSECVESMRIGTIHSLSKRILTHYAVHLGLGHRLKIVSGKYEKDRFLASALNNYIENMNMFSEHTVLPMYALQKRLSEVMTKLQNKSVDVVKDGLDWGKAEINPAFHDLITTVPEAVEQQTRAYFDDRSEIRLSDLMIKLKELVRDYRNQLTTEGFPVQYVFVDEFQDTDDVQIDLIKQFKEVFNFSLFVVGDVKQCIYRFRGANNKAFDVLAPPQEKGLWSIFSLTKNYRTDRFLLEAYGRRFTQWGDHGLLEYGEADHLTGVALYNEFLPENSFYYRETKWKDEDRKNARLIIILKKLMKNIESLPNEKIAILVRENKEVEKIKEICAFGGLGVETDVGGLLYRLQPTIDLYKLVKALQHHKTPKHLFNLYSTYYINEPLPKEALFINHYTDTPTERLLGLFDFKLTPIPHWDEYIRAIKFQPVLKVLREIVLALKPWINFAANEFSEEDRHRAQTFYRHNLDAVFEKLAFNFNSDYLTISRIERYLEILIFTEQKAQSREPLISTQNAQIICSTVHKAKGLEYHTVVLPYTSNRINAPIHRGDVDIITLGNRVGYSVKTENYQTITNDWYQSLIAAEKHDRRDEEARVLYVAMTRAKQRLIYFDNQQYAGTIEEPKNWQMLLRGDASR